LDFLLRSRNFAFTLEKIIKKTKIVLHARIYFEALVKSALEALFVSDLIGLLVAWCI